MMAVDLSSPWLRPVRGCVQSVAASSPQTVHVRAPTVSATSPRPCPGHARRRIRGQSMSVAVSGPWPCPGRGRPHPAHVRELSYPCPVRIRAKIHSGSE
jgi:hypothetical protein